MNGKLEGNVLFDLVTRLEVISSERLLVKYNIKIKDVMLQDDGRTLKIIISEEI